MTTLHQRNGERIAAEVEKTLVVLKAKSSELDKLVNDMKRLLSNSWREETREAIIDTIKQLTSITGSVTDDEIELILDRLESRLGTSFAEALAKPLVTIHEAAYLMGMQTAAPAGVAIDWRLPDRKSLNVLQKNTSFWIGEHYNDHVQEKIEEVLRRFFEGGQDRAIVADNLKTAFQGVFERSNAYWDLLADHTCTKVREIGRVSGYEQAGIEYVQFRAHLDERTTVICRTMHGRIIAVNKMRRQVDDYLDACASRDKDRIKESWPWVSNSQAEKLAGKSTADIVKGNVSMPPLHARCRSITVAWFAPEDPARLDYGDAMGRDAKKAVGAYTADEHRNFIDEARRKADSLEYSPKHLRADFEKVRITKHVKVKQEFGGAITSEADLLGTARNVLKTHDAALVKLHDGEIQYEFYSKSSECYAVLSRDQQFVGCFGHPKPGGITKCLQYRKKSMAKLS
jgi:hypothetical protein